ncbi:ubiquitin carboxyl-terminal hydrolase 33-like [Schistocerca gregaria]|uniref:ubiquitin carboxyl-terminal hydrolase 33-like n=1 Tax=Schistocerca gregaria TaxID=7010 RepID=UPI00211F14CF|nr:ubiquitin carboxyl-terminal hydrolase 33-like [Schistocerca gregaria]
MAPRYVQTVDSSPPLCDAVLETSAAGENSSTYEKSRKRTLLEDLSGGELEFPYARYRECLEWPPSRQSLEEQRQMQSECRGRRESASDSSGRGEKPNRSAIMKTPTQFVGGICGLMNLGNTCFLNAVLQCLSNIPPLRYFFLVTSQIYLLALETNPSLSSSKGEERSIDSSILIPLAKHYTELMRAMWENGSRVASPEDILADICKINPMFQGHNQHESQELMYYLLKALHDPLKIPYCARVTTTNNGDSDNNKSRQEKKNDFSALDSDQSPSRDQAARSGPKSEATERHSIRKLLFAQDEEYHRHQSYKSQRTIPLVDDSIKFDSPISSLFEGVLLSQVKCSRCQHIFEKFDPFYDLGISIVTKENGSGAVQKKTDFSKLNFSKHSQTSRCKLESSVCAAGVDCYSQDVHHAPLNRKIVSKILGVPLTIIKHCASVILSFVGFDHHSQTVSLEDCMHEFCISENLTGEEKYQCERCDGLYDAQKALSIYIPPPVLCLHLKRFCYNSCVGLKMNDYVPFPLKNFDITPFCTSSMKGGCQSPRSGPLPIPKYDLVGVICHEGTLSSGHYIAYAYNSEAEKWFQFDDDLVQPVSVQKVSSVDAYILFYQQQSGPKHFSFKKAIIEAMKHHINQLALFSQEKYPQAMQGSLRDDFCRIKSSLLEQTTFLPLIWLEKWKYMAHPGPIQNLGITCPHGKLNCHLSSSMLLQLTIPIPKSLYRILQQVYDGEPAIVSIQDSPSRLECCRKCCRDHHKQ